MQYIMFIIIIVSRPTGIMLVYIYSYCNSKNTKHGINTGLIVLITLRGNCLMCFILIDHERLVTWERSVTDDIFKLHSNKVVKV